MSSKNMNLYPNQ